MFNSTTKFGNSRDSVVGIARMLVASQSVKESKLRCSQDRSMRVSMLVCRPSNLEQGNLDTCVAHDGGIWQRAGPSACKQTA